MPSVSSTTMGRRLGSKFGRKFGRKFRRKFRLGRQTRQTLRQGRHTFLQTLLLLLTITLILISPATPSESSIHDGKRSSSSSNAFFNLLDGNGDATLTAGEIKRFIKERFRGDESLDEDVEVDEAVKVSVHYEWKLRVCTASVHCGRTPKPHPSLHLPQQPPPHSLSFQS